MASRPRLFFVLALVAFLLGAAGDRASSLHARENANGSTANERGASAIGNLSPLSITAGGDTCASPTVISALPFNDSGDTSSATNQMLFLNMTCAGGGAVARPGPDLIYSVTVYPDNSLTFQVNPAPGYDIDIYLLGICGNGETCVQESDSGVEGQSETIGPITLNPGTYYLFVDSIYTIDDLPGSGAYTLSVTGTLGTPNNTSFYTLTPCRVLDTRDPAGPWGGPALSAGAVRAFTIAGRCFVPMTAKSVAVNITVTEPTSLGHLTLFPSGTTPPLASTINFQAGQTRANNAILPLGSGGTISVVSGQPTGTVHFILDVNGYFQ